MASFGQRLREIRTENNLTQKEFAKIFKLSESAIGMYERDEREPSFKLTNDIADRFEVSTDYLLGRSDIRHPTVLVGSMVFRGDRVAAWRERKKLTQEELASKAAVTKADISNYENGHSTPSNETLVALADVLDVDTDYLLGRTDKPRSMEMSLSFYGGGDDLTEDEIEEMEAALFRYRKTKERLQKQLEDNDKK